MILILAIVGFTILLIGMILILKDFSRFILHKIKKISFPKEFVDFGEQAVSVYTICIISIIGFLFYKFTIAFIDYFLTKDLISFFVLMRGVFTTNTELQNPISPQNILSGMFLTPAVQFITFYLIFRAIRTFMFTINHHYNTTVYREGDVLFFGFLTVLLFMFLDIFFYSQNIPLASKIAHFSYLAISKISSFCYFLAIAHIHLLKYKHYKETLPTYVKLNRFANNVIFSPFKVVFLTYAIGIILYLPFYTGIQFIENNFAILLFSLFFGGVFFFTLKTVLSKGFNYIGVILLAESPEYISPNPILFNHTIEKKLIIGQVLFVVLLFLLKVKIFFFLLFFFLLFGVVYLIFLLTIYFIHLGISILHAQWWLRLSIPNIKMKIIREYLIANVKGTLKAGSPMLAIILMTVVILSFFPKKFVNKNDNFILSAFDKADVPLFVESTGGNDCIPISYDQIPDFLLKCIYIQEDRCFPVQNSFLPKNYLRSSNWHGFSFAIFYRMFMGGGGSNLNMQLIKNMGYPKTFPQDIQRKFYEIIASYQLSLQCNPEDIISHYLNRVSVNGGQGHSGIMTASLYTFGLPPNKLNYLEVMYLVLTLKRGSQFRIDSGFINYQDAERYKKEIKKTLVTKAEVWQEHGLITKKELVRLKSNDLRFLNKKFRPASLTTTNEFLKKQLNEYSLQGKTFLTSISQQNQQSILTAVGDFERKFKNYLQKRDYSLYSAALVVNVKTGEIIAHHGGSTGVTDLTTLGSGSPMASLIKPFLLLEMLEEKINVSLYDGKIPGKYTPNNSNHIYSNRYVGVTEILSKSLNAPVVNIREVTSPIELYSNVENRFKQMGIPPDPFLYIEDSERTNEIVLNYPLGSRNMTLLNIAQAYQTLLNDGVLIKLSLFKSAFNPLTNKTIQFPRIKKQIYNSINTNDIKKGLTHTLEGTASYIKPYLPQNQTFYIKTGTSDKAKHGYTVLSDGEVLIITYISYGKIIHENLELNNTPPIPHESGGHSAAVLAALIYNQIRMSI